LKSQGYRHRPSWDEDSFFEEELFEPRSAIAEYSPIVVGGLMLVAAFAFAGHYIGSNASAHTAASIADLPSLPQTTTLANKSSLLPLDETFGTVTADKLFRQTVLAEGKTDLYIPGAGQADGEESEGVSGKMTKLAAAGQDKRIKIVPAAINLKAEQDVAGKAVKKLALASKPATLDDGIVLTKAEKKKQMAQRRIRQAEENCLARAVYFEARSESEMGQMAVAKVILNRVKDPNYPKTICGVVYQGSQRRNSCQFSFACDGLPDDVKSPQSWARSKRIAQKAISGEMKMGTAMNQATNYHADYVKPKWSKSMRKLVKIGTHIFYSDG
jgi:spore germination cell wall hydrolase CwlJ-like protein